MNFNEIKFVALPEKSYYLFRLGKSKEGIHFAQDYDENTKFTKIDVNTDEAWKFVDPGLDYYNLGKRDEDGRPLGGDFSWEERIYSGPEKKAIFKWVTIYGEQFYVTEEIPPHLASNRYRFQYRLVPIKKALEDLGVDPEEFNKLILQESSI